MNIVMQVGIDERLLTQVLVASQAQGEGFDEFLEAALRVAVGVTGVQIPSSPPPAQGDALLNRAVQRAEAIAYGTEFHLDDVCEKTDWEILSPGERKILGKLFRKAVESRLPQIAEHAGRTSGNKAIYRRV